MKVILINPSFNRYGGVKGHGGTMMPLNLCYLAAYGRRKHPDVEFKILDAEIKDLAHEETTHEVKQFAPDLIGVCTNTCVFDSVIALVKLLKKELPRVPILLGGPHVSALPEWALNDTGADLAARGEGELIFEEVVRQLKSGKKDWSKIKGLAYRDGGGKVEINPSRELIEDLDSLPFPARDLVTNELYSPPPTKRARLETNTLIATSRGCPFNCGFCAAHTVWTPKVRTRSTKSVMAEIEECVEKYKIRTFHFTDELFTINKNRVTSICQSIIESGFNIKWVCSARAQGLDLETFQMMKRAGCYEISFGVESGSPEMLERMDKKLDLDEAQRVVKLAQKAGITTHATYVMGYIGETEDTIKQTIRFAKRLNTYVAAFLIASPLPGTRLYKEALENGYLRSDATWVNYALLPKSEPILSLPSLSSAMLKKWQRKALISYHLRPSYLLSRMFAIRQWCDVANLWGGFRLLLRLKKLPVTDT